MAVIKTDEWLLKFYDDPVSLCDHLITYFDHVSAQDIYSHLTTHGMYLNTQYKRADQLQILKDKTAWAVMELEFNKLQEEWSGPDVPVFIFPADVNRTIQKETGGKSGLAFNDKLFLFISDHTTETELKALLTHEYNHVCRLTQLPKKEADYILLDTIILEGLAENAVLNRLGRHSVAPWVTYYDNWELEKIWRTIVSPNKHLPIWHPTHQHILYGQRLYPKMAGYAVGYYIVKKYIETHSLSTSELLDLPSKTIAEAVKQHKK